MKNLQDLLHSESIKSLKKLEKSKKYQLQYDSEENLIHNYSNLFNFEGLYCFLVKSKKTSSTVYVGKNEGGGRIRQHITNKNVDGTPLASSVSTKFSHILKEISKGHEVYLSLHANPYFDQLTLSSIEIGCILKLKSRASIDSLPDNGEWNTRIS